MTGHALSLTGERTLPGVEHEGYWFARHVAAYQFAAAHCTGAAVLDAGCGEGYGTAMLAETASTVVGVDVAPEVVAHARAAYPQASFEQADLAALPLDDDSIDVVVSLQVIEHLPDVPAVLAETTRVLRPGGLLVCATPNRLTFTPESDIPVNPFHITEFTSDELTLNLNLLFTVRHLLGVHHGARLAGIESEAGRTLSDMQLAVTPDEWSPWLEGIVASVQPSDFEIRPGDIAESLDLIAVAMPRKH